LGLKYNVTPRFDLGLEYLYNPTRTDVLDAFSYEVFKNRTPDSYSNVNISLGYKFGKGEDKRHVDWINPVESVYASLEKIDSQASKLAQLVTDEDGDGVADLFDKEPKTPKGAKVWGDGSVVDIDKDGIPDHLDKEPFSEPGAEVAADGSMVDRDNDGIPDYRDEETNTPNGVAVDRLGKTIKLAGSGGQCCDCKNLIFPALKFQTGSARIDYASTAILHQIAETLKKCPEANLVLESYSYRNKTGASINYKRANAAIDYLNAHYAIPRDRFEHKPSDSLGSKQNLDKNTLIFHLP
jgi:outer membrane protein OmpA-like peptidoglycan-associated protein